jgi:WD40 repeat protein
MAFQAEFKVAKQIMSIVRFSPDGASLACAGSEPNIYFYSLMVPEGAEAGTAPVWTQKAKIETTLGSLSLDFSADGTCIRVVDSTDNLSVYDASINIGAPVKNAEVLRSLTWASSTTPCSWDTKGVFKNVPVPREGEECAQLGPGLVEALGAVDRSQHLFVNAGMSGVMTVTRVPADADLATDFPVGKSSLPIHCGRVSAVCFIEEGTRLVTAGADDGVLQVWKVIYDTDEPEAPPAEGEPEVLGEEELAEANAPKDAKGYDSAEEEDYFDDFVDEQVAVVDGDEIFIFGGFGKKY